VVTLFNEGNIVQPVPQPDAEPAPKPQPVPNLIDTYSKTEVDDLLSVKLVEAFTILNEEIKVYIEDSLQAYDLLQDEETKQYFESAVGNFRTCRHCSN